MATYREILTGLSPTHHWALDGNGNDSVGTQHLTLNASPATGAALIAEGSSIDFEAGSSQYGEVADHADWDGYSSFTIVLIIQPETVGVSQGIMNHRTTAPETVAGAWEVYLQSTGQFLFECGDGTTTQFHGSGAQTINAGSRYHYAFVWNGTNAQHFLNGTATAAASAYSGLAGTASTATLKIARRGFGGEYFDGLMDEVALWKNTALTSTNIADLAGAMDNAPVSADAALIARRGSFQVG